MRKFEQHDGKLWLMLDKPVPLTLDAEMPCLVRLIQDDSPMGLYNKSIASHNVLEKVVEAYEFGKGDIFNDLVIAREILLPACSLYRFEIIGTLVEDGSAEWVMAMRQSKKSVINDNGCVMHYYYDDDTCEFILRVYPSGWQLYTSVWQSYEPCELPEPDYPVVERPLRKLIAEAKKQGKNLRTWYQDLVFTPDYLEDCLSKGRFRWWSLENWKLTDRKQNMQPESEPQADLPIADEPQAVKPSEIIIKITLEGTVRPGINESCFEISTPNGGWATIGKDEITADELELVESLLKAQEEQ